MSTTAAPSFLSAPYVSHVPGEASPRLERGPDQIYNGPAIRVDLAGYGGAFWLGYEGGTMAERSDDYAAHLIDCANAAPTLAALLRSAVGGVGHLARTAAKGETITPERVAEWEQWERNARAALEDVPAPDLSDTLRAQAVGVFEQAAAQLERADAIPGTTARMLRHAARMFREGGESLNP